VNVDLSGKVAIVTGSGRGLGQAYALALANAGCAVLLNDLDEAAVSETKELIREAGGEVFVDIRAVGDAAAAEALVAGAVKHFGRLDVMCTNAGVLRDRTLAKMTDDEFDAVIHTHLRGTFTCARSAAAHMREQGSGRLIFVSSISGQLGNFGQVNYAAAKAGIAAMARSLAIELQRYNITVNAIIPNAITRMVTSIPGFEDLGDKVERGETLPADIRKAMWLGPASDVAPLVVFLSSDQAAGITGQCIAMGGDKLALWRHPEEKVVAYREGGWNAEAVAEIWPAAFQPKLEPFGIPVIKRETGS
jgi:3-oxoacyl-[acyl-carrier protein] reductase